MIVILASCFDKIAKDLVERWRRYDAGLLTCKDLSTAGWKYYPNNIEASMAIVSGKVVSFKEIKAVLTRLSFVTEEEVTFIHRSDRGYVASEMMAFLVSFLSSLKCPVLNRPTPTCLSGPSWHWSQWVSLAAKLNIPTYTDNNLTLSFSLNEGLPGYIIGNDSNIITAIGDKCYGGINNNHNILAQAKRLANAANTTLLSVYFNSYDTDRYKNCNDKDHYFFAGADPSPYIISNEIADAIIDYLK